MNFVKLTLMCLIMSLSATATAGLKRYPPPNPDMPFSLATQVDNIVYLSGQIAADENGQLADNITEQSHQVMKNIKSALNSIGLDMEDIFKCTVMIDDIAQWPDFNKVYVQYFSKGALPARSAFGVDGLAMGSMLEVECMAHKRRM